MLSRMLLTCVVFVSFTTTDALAQYFEFYQSFTMEGQNPYFEDPAGLEDPSFEFPLSQRPSQDKIFVSKDFETQDLNAVESLTRTWTGTEDEERVLGRKFVRINGSGCFANWFPIRPLTFRPFEGPSLGHYVTVRAKQDGPFEAIFGINYFDSNWNLLQKNSQLISGGETGVSRGDGDLLKKYTIPVRVPYEASFGQVWIAAPYADGTTTFDFLNVFTELRYPENARFNPNANLLRNSTRFAGDLDYYKTGYEFWNVIPGSEAGVKVDYWMPELQSKALLLGQPGSITNVYQVFDAEANQAYSVRLITDPRPGLSAANSLPHARGWFGVDFFDSDANKIDQIIFDISQGESITDATYSPVANVDFGIAWFYVEPLFRDEVLPIYEVDIRVPLDVAAAKASATNVKTAKLRSKASKSTKRTASAARSPITSAMALQARNLLPLAGSEIQGTNKKAAQ